MEVPEFAFLSFYKGGAPERYRQWRAVYSERFTYVTVDDWLGWENSNIPQNGGAAFYDRKADPFQQKPIFRGEGADALMDKMHTALKKHLDEQNDPFLENCWAERSGKETVTDPTARYDALIDRYYKQVP